MLLRLKMTTRALLSKLAVYCSHACLHQPTGSWLLPTFSHMAAVRSLCLWASQVRQLRPSTCCFGEARTLSTLTETWLLAIAQSVLIAQQ